MRFTLAGIAGAVAMCALGLQGGREQPQGERSIKCASLKLRDVTMKKLTGEEVAPEKPVEVVYPTAPQRANDHKLAEISLAAIGPVLGNMDSDVLMLHPACEARGLVLTSTITRSADYYGGVQKFAPWRPELDMQIVQAERGAVVTVVWKMRLISGIEVQRGDLPTGLGYDFPITSRLSLR